MRIRLLEPESQGVLQIASLVQVLASSGIETSRSAGRSDHVIGWAAGLT